MDEWRFKVLEKLLHRIIHLLERLVREDATYTAPAGFGFKAK
jgi:hypothetical protein